MQRLRKPLLLAPIGPDIILVRLVERCLAGELPSGDAVKRAVRDWQPDTLRA